MCVYWEGPQIFKRGSFGLRWLSLLQRENMKDLALWLGDEVNQIEHDDNNLR